MLCRSARRGVILCVRHAAKEPFEVLEVSGKSLVEGDTVILTENDSTDSKISV
jgi:hypothetical protein